MKVIFIRGLNTYGDDNFRLGPLAFGPVYFHLQQHLQSWGVMLLPVLNMGTGTLLEQYQRVKTSLVQLPEWNAGERFHLLGHSLGGLIGRRLLADGEMSARMQSLVTIGTPHLGSSLADKAVHFDKTSRWMYSTLKFLGYDTCVKVPTF